MNRITHIQIRGKKTKLVSITTTDIERVRQAYATNYGVKTSQVKLVYETEY